VVIDEVAGQMVALLGATWRPSWAGLLIAFALFRLFDIAKPGPVGWADRRSGSLYVMADDLIAGGLAAAGTAILLTAIAL
jgi:phosphatidylglycerophosphatase A